MSHGAPATVPTNASDPLASLVAAIAAGDQQAMGDLYDLTSGLIHGVTLRILENSHDAEEVTLDVYMKAWRNASQYSEGRGSVTAWLIMMARSVAIDRIRSRGARPRALELTGAEAGRLFDRHATPELTAAHHESYARVEAALSQLSREQREVLILAFFAGLSHAALAHRLSLPLGTVKTRIRLGLLRLRTLLGESGALA